MNENLNTGPLVRKGQDASLWGFFFISTILATYTLLIIMKERLRLGSQNK